MSWEECNALLDVAMDCRRVLAAAYRQVLPGDFWRCITATLTATRKVSQEHTMVDQSESSPSLLDGRTQPGEAPSSQTSSRARLCKADLVAAAAVRVLREQYPPAHRFVAALGSVLGRDRLSRQAIYTWESGKARVPAAVIFAGAELTGMSLDDLWRKARDRAMFKKSSGGPAADSLLSHSQ